jgi:hypothetical protein
MWYHWINTGQPECEAKEIEDRQREEEAIAKEKGSTREIAEKSSRGVTRSSGLMAMGRD